MMRFAASVLAATAALAATPASAAFPVFAAKCPGGITTDSSPKGVVYINGKKAAVKKFNDNAYEARSAGLTISITVDGDGPPIISYTGKHRANGICEVVSHAGGSAAGAPAASARPSSSERAGQGQFDARGNVPCAEHKGQPMGQCAFAVARDPGGTATVVVTRPDGRTRAIFFEKGKATSADLSQADGNMKFSARKKADLYMINAGDERYEIPAAVVFGG